MQTQPAKTKKAIIIGAGPAGLTAAIELLNHTDIQPIVIEKSPYVGGISRTVRFGENRMDIGGHRFFSKSDAVIKWWLDILPLEQGSEGVTELTYQNKKHAVHAEEAIPANEDDVMLVRKRQSRIFFGGHFYEYPITLSFETLRNLGLIKMVKITLTYFYSLLFPIKPEKNLEDFFINRFGKELYHTFFKTYTEKVWGLSCTEIGADWGRQRIKGLSIGTAVLNSISKLFRRATIGQKNVETSLIEYFLYPKFGPGHLWEVAAEEIRRRGGIFVSNAQVVEVVNDTKEVTAVTYEDGQNGERTTVSADYFFSTMPVRELFLAFTQKAPDDVHELACNLQYRDFITVGLLLRDCGLEKLSDNWIYIHDPSVKVGRIQLFHNWSPSLVKTQDAHLLGFEYFCNETDDLWKMSDEDLGQLAIRELAHIGLSQQEVIDFHVERVPKAYPVYAGVYKDFEKVKAYLNEIPNFYPIGRNGMHRYNNQDHSMLTAMASVESILGKYKKEDIWNINAEEDYHEEK